MEGGEFPKPPNEKPKKEYIYRVPSDLRELKSAILHKEHPLTQDPTGNRTIQIEEYPKKRKVAPYLRIRVFDGDLETSYLTQKDPETGKQELVFEGMFPVEKKGFRT